MRRFGSTLLVLSFFVGIGIAEEDEAFIAGMKATGQSFGAIRKLEKKTDPEALKHAEKIGSVYEEMIPFFRQRNSPQAVELSEAGKAAAVQLASAIRAENTADADAAIAALGKTCQGCHSAYREKLSDGKYVIKQEKDKIKPAEKTENK
jgi:cytochrome c556